MIYKLQFGDKTPHNIEPVPFLELENLNKIEKDLENIIAKNLLDTLFEDNALMLIYQERSFQSEADIYALTSAGDLVIFELKRGIVGDDAMIQILGYTQKAGQWTYDKLNKFFKTNHPQKELADHHRDSFQLDRTLTPAEFNRNQHLYVVGSATNETLAKSLSYLKSKGISVEFIPYRIYQINNEYYFEFFSKPHDIHINPSLTKGVILDTNSSFNQNCIWEMLQEKHASAYGNQSYFADRIKKRDYVFLSHKGYGIIAGGIATSNSKEKNEEERFVEVNWLTEIPSKQNGIKKYYPFSSVTELLGHNFYWATTLKTPYLTRKESELLLSELQKILN